MSTATKHVKPDDMQEAHFYRIVYRIPSIQRYDRAVVYSYISYNRCKLHAVHPTWCPKDTFFFNARPKAGTQEIERSWIKSVEEVIPRPEQGRSDIIRLPHRA